MVKYMGLRDDIEQYWQENADGYLKSVLIHLQQYDGTHAVRLSFEQERQLQCLLAHIYQAQFSVQKAAVFIDLINSLPFVAMYFLFKSTKLENPQFIESLLKYVFDQPSDAAQSFKSKVMLIEKAQLLVRYLNVENLDGLTKELK